MPNSKSRRSGEVLNDHSRDSEVLSQVFDRIGHIEQENATLSADIRNIASAVRGVSADIRSIKDSNKPNYSIFIGMVTIAIIILGGYTSLALQPIYKDIAALDVNLQREMRDVNAVTAQKVTSLDTSLQREMRMLAEIYAQRIEVSAEEIIRLREWQDQHDKRVVGLNAAQWERIKSLERVVYKTNNIATAPGDAAGAEQ